MFRGILLFQDDKIVGMVMQERDSNLDVFPRIAFAGICRTIESKALSKFFHKEDFGWHKVPQENRSRLFTNTQKI